MNKSRTILLVTCLAGASVVLLVAPALGADDATEAPSLSLTQSEGLELVVSGEESVTTEDGRPLHDGRMLVTLYNTGPKAVTPEFALVRNGTKGECRTLTLSDDRRDRIDVAEHASYTLELSVPTSCIGVEGTLLVDGTPSIDTVTGEVSIVREVSSADYFPPLIGALVAGLSFAALTLIAYGKQWTNRTASGTSWTFAGSWLTSITALSTALAGVLAATGFVSEVLPGVPIGHFLGLSLTFGLLVVAAPMVFMIFQVTELEPGTKTKDNENPELVRVVNGRLGGVIAAGSLTCAGVAGQLTMLAVLTRMSQVGSTSQQVVLGLLLVAALGVGSYVVVATKQAKEMSRVPMKRDDRGRPIEATDENTDTGDDAEVVVPSGFAGAL